MNRKLAIAAVAAVTLAGPALAQQSVESFRIGAAVGTESAHWYRGVGLRADLEFPGDMLGRRGGYAWVVSGGYSHLGRTIADPYYYDTQESWRLDVFKVVPAFRLFASPSPRLRFYGDAGVGLYMATYAYEWTATYYPYERVIEYDDTSVLLRFALGGSFALKPNLSLGGELGMTSYLGDVGHSTFNGLVTLMWKL